eukprot:TRINITY_DN2590_c0_g1_i1.p1 TRINITY_DN2590_c0_g1~~TRINITY_DN2590_c0_g1_i1.p1  ORF type:complete len:235 (+),score=39.02 TRINITY_DN2590_c0_g1_i1:28-705(+)
MLFYLALLISLCQGQMISWSQCDVDSQARYKVVDVVFYPDSPSAGAEFSVDITGLVKPDFQVTNGIVAFQIFNPQNEMVFFRRLPICDNTTASCALDSTLSGLVPAYLQEDTPTNVTYIGKILIHQHIPGGYDEVGCITFNFTIRQGRSMSDVWGCSGCAACGTAINSFNGVRAFSNGGDQCTGNSCRGRGTWGEEVRLFSSIFLRLSSINVSSLSKDITNNFSV